MNRPILSSTTGSSVLPSGFLDRQATGARLRQFSRGETISEPGLTAFVGYVISGTVKLVTFLPDGRANIIGIIEAPGFFGRIFGVATEFIIEAATDVVLACFDRTMFEAQLSANPDLEHVIHMENLHQLDAARERILVLACQSIIERMATFMVLKLLSQEVQTGERSAIVHVPMVRRDFATYLGTTVESVSRSIQALVHRGTIAIIDSATFRILRRGELIAIAGQDEDDLLEMLRSRGPTLHSLAQVFTAPDPSPGQFRERAAEALHIAAE